MNPTLTEWADKIDNRLGPISGRDADALAVLLRQTAETIATLERQVYVPGLWRCPKCEFQLIQANLNASDGTVTARDTPGDKCPNCHCPLWRVTERQSGADMVARCEAMLEDQVRLDWLERVNRRPVEGARFALKFALVHENAVVGNLLAPSVTVRQAIDAARAEAEGSR